MKSCRMAALAAFIALAPLTAAASLPPASYTVTKISLTANDLSFNAASGEYLITLGSLAGPGLGNSLTRMGVNGTVLSSTFVGSEPGRIALARGGSIGYIALNGAPMVARFDGSSGASLGSFLLGNNWSGANYAESLAVNPDDASQVAISLRNNCCSPRHEGVALYDDGVKVGAQTGEHTGSNSIAFGASGATLYGYNNETSEFGLRTMSVGAAGLQVAGISYPGWGYGTNIWFDGGLVISDRGAVFDPKLGVQIGRFALTYGDAFVTDAAQGLAYGLSREGVLTAYDFKTFVPLRSHQLGAALGDWNGYRDLVLGVDGNLAVLGNSGGIYLLSAAVPELPPYALMGVGLGLLALSGRRKRRVAQT